MSPWTVLGWILVGLVVSGIALWTLAFWIRLVHEFGGVALGRFAAWRADRGWKRCDYVYTRSQIAALHDDSWTERVRVRCRRKATFACPRGQYACDEHRTSLNKSFLVSFNHPLKYTRKG